MTNQFLIHPDTGAICFGTVLEMKSRGDIIPAGEIRLMSGRHIGPNKGWGAVHIWEEHSLEMKERGHQTFDAVPAYVATIIRQGTPLYFSGGNFRNTRVMAVRTSTGTAILEFKDQREGPIWSVVTAYSGTKAHGTRVGTVR